MDTIKYAKSLWRYPTPSEARLFNLDRRCKSLYFETEDFGIISRVELELAGFTPKIAQLEEL